MDRMLFTCVLVAVLGIWIQPYVTGAFGPAVPTTMPTTAPTSVPASTPATRPADIASPTTKPVSGYATLRGTDGFWRLGKSADGVWWFVSPTGQQEFLNTVTTVQPFQEGRDAYGPRFLSRDWNGDVAAPDDFKNPAELKAWADKTLARVKDKGFKGLGAWCNPIFHDMDVPIARDLNLWTYFGPSNRRLYHPDWRATAEQAVIKQVEKLRDNKNLVGYYTDNELDWGDGSSGPAYYFNGLPVADPNRQAVMSVIKSTWPDIRAFNSDWNTAISEFSELDEWTALPHEPAAAYARLYSAFLEKLSRDYFTITSELVRKHDPNHLVLGVRFRGYAPPEVVRGSRGLTDAQSLNYYVPDALLDTEMFTMMNKDSGDQPVIITEYSFHSLDGRSGNRNTFGFQSQVPDQQARADGYRLFTTRLARVPYVVGADWFQWSDEPPSGRKVDGEDVNFGIVDIDDRGYDLLGDAVRETTPKLNSAHASSPLDPKVDIWRDSYANKPTFNVPYLLTPIRINGELSDWSEANRLPNMRVSQTVGLERLNPKTPRAYLGHTDAGIYLGLEVFDDDIQGAPADGAWWTRDNVEIWIQTRPADADQTFYNVYSHQFFFVPIEFPGRDGLAGTVGQWDRPGDAIKQNLIPHPDIRVASRTLPGRYVVEMFIPNKALNGFDPAKNSELAFNLHVRNFEDATDFFWSAPKEVMTQYRPNTWGKIKLLGKEVAVAK